MMLTMEKVGIHVETPAPRGRDRRPGRDRHAVPAARQDGRRADVVQVHRQERRPQARQDGDVHAEAALRRQRLAACTATSRSGRASKPLFAGDGYAGMSRAGAALHRRHPQARARRSRVHQPDDQQLPPPGPGLRGAGEPGVLAPQPLGGGPHPDVLAVARRRSASRSASPIRPATPTWRSPRC